MEATIYPEGLGKINKTDLFVDRVDLRMSEDVDIDVDERLSLNLPLNDDKGQLDITLSLSQALFLSNNLKYFLDQLQA